MRSPKTKSQISNKKKIFRATFCLLPLLLPTFSFAQQKNLPLNNEWDLKMEREINKIPTTDTIVAISPDGTKKTIIIHHQSIHSSFRPMIESHSIDLATYNRMNYDPLAKRKYGKGPLWYRKIKMENLMIVRDTADKFYLTIDPLFDLQKGEDRNDRFHQSSFNNTRGVWVKGDVGQKFSFESTFYENQSAFVSYIDSFNRRNLVVPGQGRWKTFKVDKNDKRKVSYDYAMASGYFSYSPTKHFNFQAGHGKHFIGDGYRSLLLSDNSFNYPFVRLTTTFGNFQYTNLYSVFMNLIGGAKPIGTEPLYQKKIGNFQFLSWNVHNRIQVGFFQATISNATSYRNKFDLEPTFFDPLLFGNAIQYGLHNTYNVLLGTNVNAKITKSILAYGQFMLDDISRSGPNSVASKHGFQLGAKYFNAFKLKDLFLQAEVNIVRPYSYSSDTLIESYSHYHQALAHPVGANFMEFVGRVNYRIADFFIEYQLNYTTFGQDSTGKFYGKNILQSSTNAVSAPNSTNFAQNQGRSRTIQYTDLKIGYLINPATNMNIVLGITDRILSAASFKGQTRFVYVGFRTSLSNHYYDF